MRLDTVSAGAQAGLRQAVRALRHRNYRLFFLGQGISLCGTWMQQVAMSWLVYRLTGSPHWLGWVAFAGQIPSLVVMPLAGVLVDRWPRRRILYVTQTVAMLLAGVLAALALTDTIAKWHIVVVAVVGGIVNALDMPARHAFVVEMVQEKEDLASAIALNSTLFNGARLIGPSLAGFLVAAWSEGGCFLINAISFLAVLAALTAMRVSPRPIDDGHESLWASLRDGMQYVRGSAPIKAALLTLAAISLIGLPYAVLMPMFARDVLHGGPHTLGLLVSASAAGSVLGAIYLASRHTVVGLERGIPVALAAFSLSALVFASSRDLWLSVAVLVGAGGGLMVVFASCNTLVQTVVDDDKRGRVMSLYTLSFAGTSPFGALLVGALAGRFGAPTTVIACGVACLLTAVFYAAALPRLGAALRPVYDGLQTHAPTEERPDE